MEGSSFNNPPSPRLRRDSQCAALKVDRWSVSAKAVDDEFTLVHSRPGRAAPRFYAFTFHAIKSWFKIAALVESHAVTLSRFTPSRFTPSRFRALHG